MSAAPDSLIADLQDALGPHGLLVGQEVSPRYWGDLSSIPPERPLIVARPSTVEEVSAVLRIAHEAGVPVVPQGGLTGLCGGAVPAGNCIALSLERFSGIEEVDPVSSTMTVKAGTPLQVVQAAADQAGLFYPVDFGSRGSCTIGGNVSTNAGGMRVIRYGMTRASVLGLEAVLADGTVVSSLNKMIKNNAGYDLKQMFIGSEGTLGVITRVVLRLAPRPASTSLAILCLQDYAAAVKLLQGAREGLGPKLSAFEAMWPDYWEFATRRVRGIQDPVGVSAGMYVLMEAHGSAGKSDEEAFEDWLGMQFESGVVQNGTVARSLAEARSFWAIRDANSEFSSVHGPGVSFDIGLAIAEMDRFAERNRRALTDLGSLSLHFGHVGDGNLHVLAQVAPNLPDGKAAVEETVYGIVAEMGGTISAEHGIGLSKKRWLDRIRSPEEIAVMRMLKHTLDPANLLNPGKVI